MSISQFIELGIYAALSADPSTSAIAGNFYIGTLAANHCIPAVLIRCVSRKYVIDMDRTEQLRAARVQFDCIDFQYPKSLQIAAAVSNLLVDFTGALPNGLVVESSMPQTEMDSPMEEAGRGGQPVNRRILDIEFWFEQS